MAAPRCLRLAGLAGLAAAGLAAFALLGRRRKEEDSEHERNDVFGPEE